MDPISHAASGALLALALPERPQVRYFVPLAALVAASPDLDVLIAPAPIDFLLLHRGITHSLFAIPFMAMFIALLFYPFWRKTTPGAWSYFKTCIFISFLLLLHLWLDCITTYGTMIFLPFSEYRVRLNGIFIIDLLITIPMLIAIFYGLKNKKIASLMLLWIFIYPSACVGLRMWHEHSITEKIGAENITNIAVLPDAFAPLYWRVIYESKDPFDPNKQTQNKTEILPKVMQGYNYPATDHSVHHQGLNMLGQARTDIMTYPALSESVENDLRTSSYRAKAYLDFSLMPIERLRPFENGQEFVITDLRFGTMLPFVQSIMQKRNDGAPPFMLKARRNENYWTEVRLIFGGSGKDSAWQKAETPKPMLWWQWIVGI